jgi:hypothetical protein
MTGVELDRLWQGTGRKVASAEITRELRPLPNGLFDEDPRVIATLDDGHKIELFSFCVHQRAFTAEEFVGLTVDEARRLKFAPDHRLDLGPRVKDGDDGGN